jgi:hypothetical protein
MAYPCISNRPPVDWTVLQGFRLVAPVGLDCPGLLNHCFTKRATFQNQIPARFRVGNMTRKHQIGFLVPQMLTDTPPGDINRGVDFKHLDDIANLEKAKNRMKK